MAKPATLLYLITDSGIGGTEKVLLSLLKNLPKEKYDVTSVVVLKKKREMAAEWEKSGVSVTSFGMNRWPTFKLVRDVAKVIEEVRPDIVHAFLFHSIQVARMIRRRVPGFKLITSPRVNYKFAPAPALWVDHFLKKQDDLTLCESQAGKKSLVEQHGYSEPKVRVAWNSVDPQRYQFNSSARERIRREWGVSDDEILLGSVGRLHSQKGFDVLIAALAELPKSHQRYKAVIVGSGPERDTLERLAREKSVRIQFVGERSDIPAVLSAFDVYIQSSRYEGLSNALLEAMSVGVACVATAVDGTLDFAEDGRNLLLVPPNNSGKLALALATIIEKASLRAELARNAKITASQFSLDRMIRGFEEAYDHVRSVS